MALSSLYFPSFQQTQFPQPFTSTTSSTKRSSPPLRRSFSVRPITASISEKPSVPTTSTPATTTSFPDSDKPNLPIRKIPGDYGLPFIGPMKDRDDYFYNQGRDEFFKSRIQKYQSTVFRVNMPPGPPIVSDPRVIALLDGKSFQVLFDNSKVEKRDLFTGTFMPSTELTGGYRILSYLDPSEPNHASLKKLLFFLLKSRRDHVIPEFTASIEKLFEGLESELATNGKVGFNTPNDQAVFNFLSRFYFGANPADSPLGSDGPRLISKWVLFNLSPVLSLGLPKPLEQATIRTFRLPSGLIKKDYKRLYDFFYSSAGAILDEAQKLGLSRDEACHNLIFATCFNSFGGFKIIFPNALKWLARAGVRVHTELAKEIRSVVKSNGGKITMGGMEQMPLLKSAVYELLRLEPPVPLQFGRAKRDMVIESHDASFQVKEGEMLFGFQPFATKDARIFDRANEFVLDRFVGEGEKLLKHVLWSNGPETQGPTLGNKQCAGKDLVVLVTRMFIAELFLRYDSFDAEAAVSPLGAAVTIKSLKRASF